MKVKQGRGPLKHRQLHVQGIVNLRKSRPICFGGKWRKPIISLGMFFFLNFLDILTWRWDQINCVASRPIFDAVQRDALVKFSLLAAQQNWKRTSPSMVIGLYWILEMEQRKVQVRQLRKCQFHLNGWQCSHALKSPSRNNINLGSSLRTKGI